MPQPSSGRRLTALLMPYLLVLAFLLFASPTASAQVVLQDFEIGLKYDECYAGENVGLSTSGVPLQGVQRLQTGPLNKNKPAYYLTPFIEMRANGFVRFKHRNESNGNKDTPLLLVELLGTDGSLFRTIYTYQHNTSHQPIVAQPQVPQDGTYRVRFRFEGDSGNERVGLDELNIDGTIRSAGPPQCGPVTPSVDPPVARPDAAVSTAGASVVIDVLANDEARTYPIARGTVDLQPENETSVAQVRDIRNANGTLIGRAFADQNGLVTVTPVAGYTGALRVPYSVRDTEGHVSNIALVVVTVQGTTLDLQVGPAGPTSANVGDLVRYRTIVSNLGPGDAASATFTFVTNAALGSLAASCGSNRRLSCSPAQVSGNTVTVQLTAIPAGTALAVELTGTILGGQGVVATVESRVAVPAPDVDSNPSNNSGVVTTQIQAPPPGADVAIRIDGPDVLVPGQTATYTTTIVNNGPGTATGVTAAVTATGLLTFDGNGGDCTTAFPCAFGDLPPGATRTIATRYRSSVPGMILPLPPAVITAQAQSGNDPDPSNNVDAAQTQFNTSLDVGVAVTPATSDVPVGTSAELFVLASNAGPNPARSFTVQIVVPAGLTVVSATPGTGTITASGIWSIPEVGPGAQAELRIVVQPTSTSGYVVRATASPPPTDVYAGNDQAEGLLTGAASADLATRLVTTTPTPPVGTNAQLTVYAGNFGPTTAPGARVSVTVPPGLRVVSATPDTGVFNAAAGVWTVGPLAPAAIVSMPVVVAVDAPGTQTVGAAVYDEAGTFDSDLTNNTHALAFGVTQSADLSITMDADITAPVVGQLVTIRAVVLNGGPSPATGAAVTFTVPAGALTVSSVSVSTGSVGGNVWSLGTLAVGQRATLDAVVRIDQTGAIPVSGTVASAVTDPALGNNTDGFTFSGAPNRGQVAIDFENLTGSESCWAWPGMAPGGFTSVGVPFGRTQANPPQQLLVQLVSSQLSGGINRVVSPWVELYGAGAIRFTTKVTSATSTPRLRVYLEDVATLTPVLVFDKTYPSPVLPNTGVYDTIPVTQTGIFRVRWEFSGAGGSSRAAIDDIVIDGRQASETGGPGQPVAPFDCRPIVPGNIPPLAMPDFATTAAGTAVTVDLLANDRDPDGTLVADFVDLDPTGSLATVQSRDIYRPDGVRIGRAVYTSTPPILTFTPEPGVTGTAEIPYTVTDDAGGVSNISQVTILVGSVTADLSVTLSAPTAATAGQLVTYVMQVRNGGPDGASPVNVSHAFTGAFVQGVTCTVDAGQASCGNGIVAGGQFVVSLPGMAPGAVVSFTLTTTAPPFAGTISGAAQVGVVAPVSDPNPANDAASASTTIGGPPPPARADVAVSKFGPNEAAIGQIVRYTVVVANLGPNDAAAVAVSDPTPPGFTLLGVDGACTAVTCALGTLGVGQNRTIGYTYVVGAPVLGGRSATATNVVSVTSSTPDPQSANNSALVVTRVYRANDLAVTVAQDPSSAVGQIAQVLFTVTNAGPSPAAGVAATVTLDPGFAVVSVSASRGTYDAASGVWTIGVLGSAALGELRVSVRPQAAGALVSSIALTAGLDVDTDSDNDQASATMQVAAAADVGLASSADDVSPLAGETVTLALVASNAGPSDATGVGVTGVLPAGLTYLGHTVSQGTLDTATGLWTVGTLPIGALATLDVQVRVERTGTFNSFAAVTASDAVDPNQSNNSTGVLLNAGAAADVGVEIAITPPVAELGETVAIRGVVSNHGPSEATDIAALYTVPAGLRVTGFTVSQGNASGGRWSIPRLAPGESAVIEATAVLEHVGQLTVTGSATHAEPDPNPVNNQTFASVNALGTADLRLSMVAGTPNPLISDNTTVYVVVSNEGLVTSLPVEVRVTPDAALIRVGALASQGSYDLAAGRWLVGPVPPGGTAKLALVLRVQDAGQLPVSAQIVAPVIDQSVARAAAARITLDVFDPLRTVADLQLSMAATPRVNPGGTATIAAVSQNAGSTYAFDLTMSVTVPAGARFVSASSSLGAVCTLPPVGGTGAIQCLWPGQSVVGVARLRAIEVVVQADSGVADGTRLAFAGQVRSVTPDPFPANNAAEALTVVTTSTAGADVAVSKVFEDGTETMSMPTGAVARYRVTATNGGPTAAAGVEVREILPPGLTVVSASPSQGAIDAATNTWLVGGLPPGTAATLDVAVTAAQAGRAELISIRAAATPVDANPVNDRAAIVLDVFPAGGGGRFVATGNVDGLGAQEIITGTGQYEPTQLRIFAGDGRLRHTFYPYDPRFGGGVRVAACDIDADGRDEVVTAAGEPGGGPHIRIFKVYSADRIVELTSWYAFGEPYRGGVYVACGDVNGDGTPEVVSGTGTIGDPQVLVWEVRPFFVRELLRVRPFAHATPEARVAVCDVNGDGRQEILAASGPGVAVQVAGIDGATGAILGRFGALGGLATGAFVACGDLTPLVPGPEIVVSADAGGPPVIEFYAPTGAALAGVLADTADVNGGLRVGVGDVDATSSGAELIIGSGKGARPIVRVVSGFTGVLVELRRFVVPNVP